MIIVKNKSGRFLCLLLGLMICMSGCNFGSTAQTENPPAQEQEDDGQTTEIIVPGGKEDQPEEDEEKTEEKKEEKKTQSKPFWQSETSMHYDGGRGGSPAGLSDQWGQTRLDEQKREALRLL